MGPRNKAANHFRDQQPDVAIHRLFPPFSSLYIFPRGAVKLFVNSCRNASELIYLGDTKMANREPRNSVYDVPWWQRSSGLGSDRRRIIDKVPPRRGNARLGC